MRKDGKPREILNLRDKFYEEHPEVQQSLTEFLRQYREFVAIWRKLYPPKKQTSKYRTT